MAKYSYEFKKKIVQAYLNNEGGCKYLANKYGIPAKSNVRKLVKAFIELGDEGLMRSRKNKTYTFNFKKNVVKLYLSKKIRIRNWLYHLE